MDHHTYLDSTVFWSTILGKRIATPHSFKSLKGPGGLNVKYVAACRARFEIDFGEQFVRMNGGLHRKSAGNMAPHAKQGLRFKLWSNSFA